MYYMQSFLMWTYNDMFVYLWVSQGKFMGFHCVHRTMEGTREAMKYERYHLTLLICKMKTVLCCAKLLWSCQILCESMDCNPPGSSVHGILQARILEWIAMPSSRGSSRPKDQTCVSRLSCIGRRILHHWATWEALTVLILWFWNIHTC